MARAFDRAGHLPSAYFELGRLYLASHLHHQREARKHISIEGVEDHLREVRSQLERAVLAFEEARRLNPDLPQWQLQIADAVRCLANNDFEGCVAECDRILADEPEAEEVWKLRGDAMQLAGHSPFESYEHALQIRRSYYEVCLAEAEAYLARGDVEHARESVERALVIHPECVGALVLLSRSFARGDLVRAIELADRATASDPHHYEAQVTRGELYLARGRSEANGADLDAALESLTAAASLPGCQNRVNLTTARVLLERAQLALARGQDASADLDAVLEYRSSLAIHAAGVSDAWMTLFERAQALRA
jgi:tetratricopeptide (TPR) repeat protein